MFHQAEEIRQFSGVHALFIQRQDEIAGVGFHRVVGILDTFRNSAKGQQFTKRIIGQKGAQRLIRNLSINRHYWAASPRGRRKVICSTATTTSSTSSE